MSIVDPEYPCAVHVDDLSQVFAAETHHELKDKLLRAGRLVGSEVKRLRLKLSTKSTVIPLNDLTCSVARTLTDEGIPLLVSSKHDDVGGEMSAGTPRVAGTLNHRMHEKRGTRGNSSA